MKKLLIFLFLFIYVTIFPHEKIIIGGMNFPPFQDSKLEQYGIVPEIVKAIFHEVGYEVSFDFYPAPRLSDSITKGRVLAGISMKGFFNENDYEKILFSDSIIKADVILFYLKSRFPNGVNLNKKEGFKTLKPYRIGITTGVPELPLLKNHGLNLDVVSKYELSFEKLLKNRIDFVSILDVIGYCALIELNIPPDEIGTTIPIMTLDALLVFSKDYPNSKIILKDFNKGIKIANKKGIITNILKKYYDKKIFPNTMLRAN